MHVCTNFCTKWPAKPVGLWPKQRSSKGAKKRGGCEIERSKYESRRNPKGAKRESHYTSVGDERERVEVAAADPRLERPASTDLVELDAEALLDVDVDAGPRADGLQVVDVVHVWWLEEVCVALGHDGRECRRSGKVGG